MRPAALFASLCLLTLTSGAALAEAVPKLEIVTELPERPGNVAVSLKGRIFMTQHPVDAPHFKLVELLSENRVVPYPDKFFSSPFEASPANPMAPPLEKPLGLRAILRDILIVLDMGGVRDGKTYPARLIGITLRNNSVMMDTALPKDLMTPQSMLQDFAFDWIDNTILIADMGQADMTLPARPAIILVYGNPFQKPRRVLENHPSVMPPEPFVQAEGKEMSVMKDGRKIPVRGALNPITIDPQRNWLYYGPMGAGKIYRVPLTAIKDINLPPEQLAAAVEVVADKPPSDGMTIDAAGNIYLTGVNANEIGIIRGDGKTWGKYETYLHDDRLIWPDGLAFGPDGMIYVTANQLNRSKKYNGGKEGGKPPYLLARFKPVTMGTIGR